MGQQIGIRRENARPWERRAPLTPTHVEKLISVGGLEVELETSPQRAFVQEEYTNVGATLTDGLTTARVVFGVKEVPVEAIEPNKTYVFFSHVIKGQSENMPMLAKLMKLRCTVIDYEKITDSVGRRLIFFGQFAGLAGMIDSFWALGQRLESEGLDTPFASVRRANAYDSLSDAKAHLREIGKRISIDGLPAAICPLVVGISGYGNVASGVQEILAELSTRVLVPHELAGLRKTGKQLERNTIYQVTFREEHLMKPVASGASFDLQEYYSHPSQYRSNFSHTVEDLTVLMNCIHWEKRYPKLVTKADIKRLFDAEPLPRLRVIGDLSCDVLGAIECTVKTTDPNDPVYVYEWKTETAKPGVVGDGPVILAVDILPTELPKESSESFSGILSDFVPAIATADYDVPFHKLDLPAEIKRATIVHRGELTPGYRYLENYLQPTLQHNQTTP